MRDSQVQLADAAAHPLPDEAATVWFTDPPYYDAVPYMEKNCEDTFVSSVPRWCRTGGARLLAVVTLRPGQRGRHYRLPTERDYEAVRKAQVALAKLLDDWESNGRQGLCPVPDEPLPPVGMLGFSVQRYGMLQWGDLFTARQKVALVTLSRLVRELTTETPACAAVAVGRQRARRDSLKEAVRLGMALIISKQSDFNSSLSRWANQMETSVATFSRQALPILWDWGEMSPIRDSSGAFLVAVDWVANACDTITRMFQQSGHVQLADATEHPLPDEAATVWFTDPPYYDAVPYADLNVPVIKNGIRGSNPAGPIDPPDSQPPPVDFRSSKVLSLYIRERNRPRASIHR